MQTLIYVHYAFKIFGGVRIYITLSINKKFAMRLKRK
jgi:hypothetical protein